MNKPVTLLSEIEITYHRNPESAAVKVTCSQDAERLLRQVFPSFEHREYFYMLCLDRSNKVLGYSQVSAGGISGTIADVRIIFQTAIKSNSSAIILAHNHPSGNCKPSEQDLKLTKKMQSAGLLLDIVVLDHLILAADGFYSFADENQL